MTPADTQALIAQIQAAIDTLAGENGGDYSPVDDQIHDALAASRAALSAQEATDHRAEHAYKVAFAWREGAQLAGDGQPLPETQERWKSRTPPEIAALEMGFAFIHNSSVAREMARRIETVAKRCADAESKLAALESAQQKLNHWHRRAQKAEAELCVTAEERARQGLSIGRGLAGATWQHYKDRAEAAEALLSAQAANLTACEDMLAKLLDMQTNEQPLMEFYSDPVKFSRDMALRFAVDRDEKKHENRQLRAQLAAQATDLAVNAKMLARQCDMAREAEMLAMKAQAAQEALDQHVAVHNTPAEWAMVRATLDALDRGITDFELYQAAVVGAIEAP